MKIYILIFKTNVSDSSDLELLEYILKKNESIIKWSVDREDIDKILRIEALKNNAKVIITILNFVGIYCSEL